MITLIRGIVKKMTTAAGRLARFDASGRADEEILDHIAFGQYGLSSNPPEGAECLLVRQGGNIYMIASDDRRYRVALSEGEVAIHDMGGNTVHLMNNGGILIKADKVVVESGEIYLGDEQLAKIGGGVVTKMCSCAVTGALHPIGSNTVKAAL